ncbi:MAG: hypothetical protein M1826_006383 [Phylliscum demangeonii]|nr:MAG: hypothetical protein M1826_006383 [Phylliscum demangeonii]
MHEYAALEEECIKTANEEVKQEASAKGKWTHPYMEDNSALYNPYHLETGKTPGRNPRLPYEHRPIGFPGDEADYIFDVNRVEIESKLKKFPGQLTPSFHLFVQCMLPRAGSPLTLTSYLQEKIEPAAMQAMRHHEDDCVDHVNRRVDADAHRQQKQAYLPVRIYPPLDPRRHSRPQQQRHEFSTVPLANWAHQAGRFVAAQGRRLHLGSLPLQKLVHEAHTKLPAWEMEWAH